MEFKNLNKSEKMFLKDFLKINSDLLDANEFTKLYAKLRNTADLQYLRDLSSAMTNLLIEANINPLMHMQVMPIFYFDDIKLNVFEIPYGVEEIESFAFCDSTINTLLLPRSIKYISPDSFYNLGTALKINKIVYNGKRNDLYLAIKHWPDALREAFLDFVTYTN